MVHLEQMFVKMSDEGTILVLLVFSSNTKGAILVRVW